MWIKPFPIFYSIWPISHILADPLFLLSVDMKVNHDSLYLLLSKSIIPILSKVHFLVFTCKSKSSHTCFIHSAFSLWYLRVNLIYITFTKNCIKFTLNYITFTLIHIIYIIFFFFIKWSINILSNNLNKVDTREQING